jgi:hypothetical protein
MSTIASTSVTKIKTRRFGFDLPPEARDRPSSHISDQPLIPRKGYLATKETYPVVGLGEHFWAIDRSTTQGLLRTLRAAERQRQTSIASCLTSTHTAVSRMVIDVAYCQGVSRKFLVGRMDRIPPSARRIRSFVTVSCFVLSD